MTREEATKEFFKELKIALSNCTLYDKGHPFFLKIASQLKSKIDILMQFVNPLKIEITTSAVLLESDIFSKEAIYEEIIRFLHSRKVKSLQINAGITVEELVAFLGSIALRPQEIFKAGGIKSVLAKERLPHLSVEELEYSQFLKDGSVQVDDIWPFLLNEVMEGGDPQKIKELAGNFGKIADKLKIEDFLANKQLQGNIIKFIRYLKEHKDADFHRCGRQIVKSFIKDKDFQEYDNVEKIKDFLSILSSDQLADSLLEQMSGDASFDDLNLKLFLRLADKNDHRDIASVIKEKIEKTDYLRQDSRLKNRFNKLFSLFEEAKESYISEVYRNTLFSFLKEESFEDKFHFDHRYLSLNYRYILLDLLSWELDNVKLGAISARILAGWEEVVKDEDWEYFISLVDVLKKKKKAAAHLQNSLLDLDKQLGTLVEESLWRPPSHKLTEAFLDYAEKAIKSEEYYLDHIFKEGEVNSYALKAFFKFFPVSFLLFKKNLKARVHHIEFMEEFVEALKGIGESPAIAVYKQIFSFCSNIVKSDILKTMQGFSEYDEDFLLNLLKKEDALLRKEALRCLLSRGDLVKTAAFEALFSISSRWPWRGNRLLKENIAMAQELNLTEAAPQIRSLLKKDFLFGAPVKGEALKILEQWNVRDS